ncbi:MAG: hypothetical protein J0H42_21065 [Rhizobiales bacterium]|nr:hypothetical protein [Hyphomicrobiales bacterium]
MTQLTMSLAATHDHWTTEPVLKHAGAAARLWLRHLRRHRPLLVDVAEWSFAATIASCLVVLELFANA